MKDDEQRMHRRGGCFMNQMFRTISPCESAPSNVRAVSRHREYGFRTRLAPRLVNLMKAADRE